MVKHEYFALDIACILSDLMSGKYSGLPGSDNSFVIGCVCTLKVRIHISKRLSLFTHLISIWKDGRQVGDTFDLDTFRESQEFGTIRKSR